MVYNNINESDYVFNCKDLTFYFSSKFYLEKFEREYVNFIKNEKMKLKIKFKCEFDCDEMIMLLLYKKIEKRGFKVLYDESPINENYCFSLMLDGSSFKE